MKIQNTKYQTSKIGFYDDKLIEIRKENEQYSLYVNNQQKSNKVSDFRIVGDYIFCFGRFDSLIYYSFKNDELFEVKNIGDYAAWSLINDVITTRKYIEERAEIRASKFHLITKEVTELENVPKIYKNINGYKFSTDNKFEINCKSNQWVANISELNLGKIFEIKCLIDQYVIAQTSTNLIGLNIKNGDLEWNYEMAPERLKLNESKKILISPKTRLSFGDKDIEHLNSNLDVENKAIVNMDSFDIDESFIYFPIISKTSKNNSMIEIYKTQQEDYTIIDKVELYSNELLNHTKQLVVNKNKLYVISQGNELTIIVNE